MAEYFMSREKADDFIRRCQDRGSPIAFFAKIRDGSLEQWMVDFRKKDYGGAITIIEDLTHTLKPVPQEITLACSHCRRPFDPNAEREDTHWRCGICERIILCRDCRTRFSRPGCISCPTCGCHERWDFIRRPENSSTTTAAPSVPTDSRQHAEVPQIDPSAAKSKNEASQPQYFVYVRQQHSGPYTRAELLSRFRDSSSREDATFWTKGMTTYETVEALF